MTTEEKLGNIHRLVWNCAQALRIEVPAECVTEVQQVAFVLKSMELLIQGGAERIREWWVDQRECEKAATGINEGTEGATAVGPLGVEAFCREAIEKLKSMAGELRAKNEMLRGIGRGLN